MRSIIYEGVAFTECDETKVTEEDLICYEKRKNTTLPDDYKKFLIATNGGKPTPCACKLLSISEPNPGVQFDPEYFGDLYRYDNKLREETNEFLKNTYIPDRIEMFFPFSSAEEFALSVEWPDIPSFPNHPDTCSLIKIASVCNNNDDSLYLSTSDKYFGRVFIGNWFFGCESLDEATCVGESLENIQNCCVAKSFTDLLKSLFSGDLILAEGYTPSKEILKICDYITYEKLYGPVDY